ncbi:amino acid adenylation domain-containing protein [Nocardia sp. BSTN01]|uniref:non-ribosomal peptide synthetase n=1 Tax=Nocardia sp. BSTN01 TaxID=2783665 RepID=UPI0018902DEA|nr:non-ribosomal peptide synthetase [Nocardia sp. BSTN01]MBF4998070.1 amino acid adenylation domain-containing protein [Nocardia sp. BSTN01]
MNATELISHLRALGADLWIDGPDLRYSAPSGAVDSEMKARLRALKPEVIAALTTESAAITDPGNHDQPFPLTDVQASYLLGRTTAFEWGGIGCHGYAEFSVADVESPRALCPDDFRRAWYAVLGRHDMLRCVVHPEGYQRIELDRGTVGAPTGLTVHIEDTTAAIAARRTRITETLAERDYSPGTGPMFDLVVTIGPADTLVHFSVDLLIADFASIALVMRDFERALRDPSTELPRPAFTFRDYLLNVARHRRSAAGRAELERDRGYWDARLDDLPAPLNLPLLPHAHTAPPHFRRRAFDIRAREWEQFTGHARARGLTPTAALLTAFARVIGRYGDSDHFLLTLTTMNRRPFTDVVDQIAGDFTGTLALEMDVSAPEPFSATVARTSARLFDDIDHPGVSGVEILRELARRDDNRGQQSPVVFTSTVGADRAHQEHESRPPLLRPITGRGLSQTPQVLLDCQVMDARDGVDIHWDSRAGTVPDLVLDRAFGEFAAAIGDLCADGSAWDRPLLPPVSPPPTPAPAGRGDRLLHSALLEQANRAPNAVAIRQGDVAVTYGQLVSAAEQVAAELRGRGIADGDHVTVRLGNGPQQVAALLGVLIAGATYIPLDVRWPQARVNRILEQCDPAVRIEPAGPIARILERPESWRPDTAHDSAAPARTTASEAAYVIFTSGTTGVPKGVVMAHEAVVNTIDSINAMCAIGADDTVLAVSQHTFDLSVYNIFGILGAGGCLAFPDSTDRPRPDAWLEDIAKHRVTVWNSVPAQLQLLLDQRRLTGEREALSGLRRILLSGDWIPTAQPAEIADAAPQATTWSLGGATEAGIWSIRHRIDEPRYDRSIPYGTALPNQSVHVLNHRGEPAAPWQIGEIFIGGMSVATGYLGDEDLTSAAFAIHPGSGERLYRTGDFGRTDEAGVIELIGRRDNQVKIRGHRIELADIESAFDAIPGVSSAVACTLGDRPHQTLAVAVAPAAAPEDELRHRAAAELSARAAACDIHRTHSANLDDVAVARFVTAATDTALRSMAATLAPALPPGRARPFDEIAAALGTATEHRPLLRRWVHTLTNRGWMTGREGTLLLHEHPTIEECAEEWEKVCELARAIEYGDQLIHYVGQCMSTLPGLLTGTADPLALLFPEGQLDIALGAYRDNLVSRYLNSVISAQIRSYAEVFDETRPLRILEVGAGVGGTTTDILAALPHRNVHYTFTDISPFFLNHARETFGGDIAEYRLFDLNLDPADQGFETSAFDIVVCANVLHNADDIPARLVVLKRLLAPGGVLAFIDSTAPNPALMISMEFKDGLTDFTDVRGSGDSPFLTLDQWKEVLSASPFEPPQIMPPDGHVLERLGQHAFWCPTSAPTAALRPSRLLEQATDVLPSYMIPQHVTIVPSLPLTDNGKVDRKRIRVELQRVTRARADSDTAEPRGVMSALQTRIAAVWADILELGDSHGLSPRSDFFALGGDSLLLAQAIGRIRRDIPEAAECLWDELLRELTVDPTVAGAERAILGAGTAVRGHTLAPSPLVRLGGPDAEPEPHRPIVVLVHDGSGGLAPYTDLIAELSAYSAIPDLYGLCRVPGDGYSEIAPGRLVATLASRYGQAIRDLRPARVHLLGYCMGGLLAVEIARYLQESAVAVGGVTVISSYRVPVEIHDDDLLDYCFAQIMGADVADLGITVPDREFCDAFLRTRAQCGDIIPSGALRSVDPRLGRALAAGPQPGTQRMRVLSRSGVLGKDWTPESLVELRSIFTHSLRAVATADYAPYLGDICFLRQHGNLHFLPRLRDDMTDFWRDHCLGRLTVVDIEGNHFDCLLNPHAAALAHRLATSWRESPGR